MPFHVHLFQWMLGLEHNTSSSLTPPSALLRGLSQMPLFCCFLENPATLVAWNCLDFIINIVLFVCLALWTLSFLRKKAYALLLLILST